MKPLLLFSSFALVLGASAFAAEPPPTDVVAFDQAKVAAMFAKGGTLLANSSYKIQAGRRVADGQVEIHAFDTDIFYVTAGSARITTGGTAVDPKEVAPGEQRADKTTGGTTRELVPGDVLVIPAGVPHWITNVKAPFLYLVVKVTGK